jgi:hypothetical protein
MLGVPMESTTACRCAIRQDRRFRADRDCRIRGNRMSSEETRSLARRVLERLDRRDCGGANTRG